MIAYQHATFLREGILLGNCNQASYASPVFNSVRLVKLQPARVDRKTTPDTVPLQIPLAYLSDPLHTAGAREI